MIPLKSKFSYIQAMFLPVLLSLISFGFATILFIISFAEVNEIGNKEYFLGVFGFVFLVMGLFGIRHYEKYLIKISITPEYIELNRLLSQKKISWKEIENIILTGKQPERFMFISLPMEAVVLELKDQRQEILFVKLYSNMDRIRTALHLIGLRLANNNAVTKECFAPAYREIPKIRNTTGFTKFGKHHLLTLNGLVVYGGWIFAAWMVFTPNSPNSLQLKIFVSSVILGYSNGLFGYQLHYFLLSEDIFIVKNHIWLWKKDTYYLKDIREIVFEEPHKMSTAMRVITNNYETKLYPAGSIRKKTWSQLCRQFEEMNISVRNEAYFD